MSIITNYNFFTQKLEKLDIMGNQIGDDGVRYLADALGNNKVKRILYLRLSSPFAIFLHRHSRNLTLVGIKSEAKEQTILPLL